MKKTLRIVIDMDETVVDLCNPWIKEINERFNLDMKYDDLTVYYMNEAIRIKYPDISDDIIKEVMAILNREGMFDDLPVYENAKKYIDKWHDEGHKIYFCSNGMFAPNSMISKYFWIKKYFPYAKTCLTDDKTIAYGDIAIDDFHEYLKDYNCTWKCLIDKPYNKNIKNDFHRIEDWFYLDKIVSFAYKIKNS